MRTYPQGSTPKPKALISFKVGGIGRVITFKPTDDLWVTNPQHDQAARGVVMVGRKHHHIGQGYAFTQLQFADLFAVRD